VQISLQSKATDMTGKSWVKKNTNIRRKTLCFLRTSLKKKHRGDLVKLNNMLVKFLS